MSRAESHAVGGDGSDEICVEGTSVGSATALSQSVRTGVGDWSFLSWMVIVGALKQASDGIESSVMIIYWYSL